MFINKTRLLRVDNIMNKTRSLRVGDDINKTRSLRVDDIINETKKVMAGRRGIRMDISRGAESA